MKPTRFEPEVLQPLADSNDMGTFMSDLEVEEQTHSGVNPPNADIIPITEFLKRKKRRKKFSVRDVAIAAYEKQRRR